MKKLLLSAAALCCFVSAQAQWLPNGATSGPIRYMGGNVGIGTDSPQYKLDVVGRVRFQALTGSEMAGFAFTNLYNTAERSWIGMVNDNTLGFYGYGFSNYGMAMNVNNGNIGLGTTNPQYKLDVVGRVRFQAVTGNATAGFAFNNLANTAERAFIGMVNDNAMGFWGYGLNNWGMTMDVNNGNVTVGTPVAGAAGVYRLNVWGRARANEIVVNTDGADFVFADNYRLRPLGEVEQFINTNNHLPEIPSAKEMQENGMAVGELQTKLLQKVEELTLYVIEQNKQLQELKEENKQLQQENTMIKAKIGIPK